MASMNRLNGPQRISHVENDEFLRRLRDGMLRLGIEAPKVEVHFKELGVEADITEGNSPPTLLNVAMQTAMEFLGLLRICPPTKRPVKILHGLKGIIKPSRMTLVIGPPGSGKSALLRALAGKLDPRLRVSGNVTYNGHQLADLFPQHTCAYVTQDDFHHPELTVRETLEFSAAMLRAVYRSQAMHAQLERQENVPESEADLKIDAFIKAAKDENGRDSVTEYVLQILGLYDCADVMIGDEMRRGISGGQKKRVTIGEMLVGLARAFFMDDISTGLDSSTTLEILKLLRKMVQLMDLTMVISLLQPSPETFDLFDDIIILNEGQIIYQGPRESVLEFFESMGFKCPERKSTGDFLQEVISKMDQAQYWADKERVYQDTPVQGFVESFHSFHLGIIIEEELHKTCNQMESNSSILLKGNYRILKWELFKRIFFRELLLTKRNFPVHIFNTVQIMVLAFVVMTVFIRTEMKQNSLIDANKYMGAILAGIVIMNLNAMTELMIMIRRIPTLHRQKDLLLLPSWALLTSIFLLSIPISLVKSGIWTSLTYFVIGFAPSATRFFQQLLAFFCAHQMATSLSYLIAVVARTDVISNALGTFSLIVLYILGGIVVSKDVIHPWWAWGSWVSPITYAQNAVALNEFLHKRWNTPNFDRTIKENTIGRAYLRSRGMFTEWYWFWISVVALLGFTLLFNMLCIIAMEYVKAPGTHQAGLTIQINGNEVMEKVDIRGTTGGAPKSGMILPFQPLSLAFRHINYYVDMPAEMKKHGYHRKRLQLLKDVSGAFRPGILTALMGVTGAGKTTLLDVLAGRKTGGYIEGTIRVSGYPRRHETFARISAYCEQTPIHSPFITVYESLQYSASLRLPSSCPHPQTKNTFVYEVMDLLELKPLKNAMVGLPGINGLSTEQRKRLSIAVELVSSPSIIFIDEPTTGLDARAAVIVMRTVRNLVDTGRTVVCTIHQPSVEIFEAFDELLLMKGGGQLIYGGPLGPFSQNMVHYFEDLPGVPKIRKGQNPAAWVLDVTSPAMEFDSEIDFAEVFKQSSLYRENMELINDLSRPKSNSGDIHFPSKYAQNFSVQFITCLRKQHWSYWKDPQHNIIRFIVIMAASFIFGTVFWDVGSKISSAQGIFNILGALYGSALFLGFPLATMMQPVVALERIVYYREKSARMYSPMPYAIAQVAIEIPYLIAQTLIFTFIVYPMLGFEWAVPKFLWFTTFMLLNFLYFSLFGMMTAALTPNQEIAAVLSFFIFLLWNFFSGFFISKQMIPIWWRWFYWVNPAAWTIYGLMVSQLGDRVELIHIPGRSDQAIKEFLEDYLDMRADHFGLIVALHAVIIITFLFVYWFSLKHFNFQKR